ncbi:MAG: hypothetical protein ACXABY_33780, partial [Candidatus Thorarchaeota archaeon]
ESVTLEVTVPGSVAAGTYTMNNLIGDYINRELLDRNEGLEEYLRGSDTSDTANPFTDGTGAALGPSNTEMFRIHGQMFSPFATATLTDNSAARTYSEQQDLWLKGQNHYSDTNDDVVGKLNFVSYTLKFKGTGDDLGIPVCTTPESQDYTACIDTGGNIDYATETHKLNVKFLGEDWIISDMDPPTTVLENENSMVAGGTVKLAKESISGILNQGDFLTADDIKFQLDDLEAHGDTGTAAIISILDANDNLLKKDKVSPGTTKEFVINQKSYRFHVYKIAPGYTFGAKWADVAVYSKELKLQNGQKLDPDYDNNKYWTVYLGWKNKGGSATDPEPDHLRTIILYSNNMNKLSSGGSSDLTVGDYIPIVMDPVKWKLSYNGLDLKSDKYDSLSFDLEKSSEYTISTTYGPLNATSGGTRQNCTINAPFIRVQSGKSGATFTLAGAVSDVADDEFYIATNGATCEGGIPALLPGAAFMQVSSSSEFWAYRQYAENMSVQYPEIGDGDMSWLQGGLISWANFTHADASSTSQIGGTGFFDFTGVGAVVPEFVFAITEKAGVGTSNDFVDRMFFALDVAGSTSDFNIDVTATSATLFKKDDIFYQYAGPVNELTTFGEEGWITERG